jgi:hypothetical protein
MDVVFNPEDCAGAGRVVVGPFRGNVRPVRDGVYFVVLAPRRAQWPPTLSSFKGRGGYYSKYSHGQWFTVTGDPRRAALKIYPSIIISVSRMLAFEWYGVSKP